MAEYLSLPVRVEAVALSDVCGKANLRVLERDRGRSTLERDNTLEDPDDIEKCDRTVHILRLVCHNMDDFSS